MTLARRAVTAADKLSARAHRRRGRLPVQFYGAISAKDAPLIAAFSCRFSAWGAVPQDRSFSIETALSFSPSRQKQHMTGGTPMNIRTATMADLSALTAVEAACFPVAEAATDGGGLCRAPPRLSQSLLAVGTGWRGCLFRQRHGHGRANDSG